MACLGTDVNRGGDAVLQKLVPFKIFSQIIQRSAELCVE